MRNQGRLVFTLLTAFLIAPVASGSMTSERRVLTLADCIGMALENSVTLETARRSLAASQERVAQARRRLWPTLSMAITENTGLGDSGAFSQYDPSTGQRFIPGEGFQASADLAWSVYDFGSNRSVIRAEESSLSLLNLSVIQIRRDLVHQIIGLYLAILERQAELDVRHEQLSRARESLNIARGRLDIGRGIAYEVLLEEAYLAQAEADLKTTEIALNQARRTLLLMLRLHIETPVDWQPVDTGKTRSVPPEMLLQTAFQNRLEFKRYQAEIDGVQRQLKTLETTRLPHVDLILSYSQQGQDYHSFTGGDVSWSAGISFRFSPFSNSTLRGSTRRNWINSDEFMQQTSLGLSLNDGTSTRSREIDLRVAIHRLRLEMETLKDVISAEVYDALEMVQSSLAQFTARQKNLAAMEENERIQQKRYELGLNHYKDVVDARTELVGARIALTRAMYSMEQYRTNLEYVLGILEYQEHSL